MDLPTCHTVSSHRLESIYLDARTDDSFWQTVLFQMQLIGVFPLLLHEIGQFGSEDLTRQSRVSRHPQ